MRAGELCAGYGGLALAVEEVFGAETAWFSEFDPAPSKILAHHWPKVPNHGDMTQIDWAAIEPVDIISGGTPCQDLSAAGKRKGMTEGTRSNLWVNMREAIATIRPKYVVWENVRGAYSAEASSDLEFCPGCMGEAADGGVVLRALGRVLGDLSDLGYDCQWRGIRAADVGAPHGRFRVFVLASLPDSMRSRSSRRSEEPRSARRHYAVIGSGTRGSWARTALANPKGVRRREGWAQPAGQLGGLHASIGGDPSAADAECVCSERRRVNGDVVRAPRTREAGSRERQRNGNALDNSKPPNSGGTTAGSDGYIGGVVNGGTSKAGPKEGLQSLREAPGAKTIRESIGGPNEVLGAGTLRPDMREQSGCDSSRLSPLEGASDQTAGAVLDVFHNDELARPSQGQEPGKQPVREPGSAVRELPSQAALVGGSGESPRSETNWGPYEPAIRRWEMVLGRQAPPPTEATGRNGGHRLSPRFTEFMMGLPDGWVTDPAIGISRNEQLKACGNGVVPQQATAALQDMLAGFQNQGKAA
jgi:DNA (cytosine-5)-methyltransferase 1